MTTSLLKDLQLQLADTFVDEDDAQGDYDRIEQYANFRINDLQGMISLSVDYNEIQELSRQIRRFITVRNMLHYACLVKMRDTQQRRAAIQQQIWDIEDGIL